MKLVTTIRCRLRSYGPEAAHVDLAFQRVLPDQLPPVFERTRQPQGGVGAGDDEGAQQQRRHAPERVEQDGVADRVVMRGVRQVAGELAVRAGMALGAGLDDVVAAEPGPRVGHREHVVRAVAVVALGGLQISELGDFAVVRLEIARGDGLVAAAALIHDVQPEIGQVGALDAVRGVAVAAHRQRLGRGMRGGRVDTGDEHFVDAAMALGAGGGHVGAVDARSAGRWRAVHGARCGNRRNWRSR